MAYFRYQSHIYVTLIIVLKSLCAFIAPPLACVRIRCNYVQKYRQICVDKLRQLCARKYTYTTAHCVCVSFKQKIKYAQTLNARTKVIFFALISAA